MNEKPQFPKVPGHIRKALDEQHRTETKPHSEGTTARPNDDWPPKGVDTGKPAETKGKGAGAGKPAETKATDDEAANTKGK